jgi:hypothetical protein
MSVKFVLQRVLRRWWRSIWGEAQRITKHGMELGSKSERQPEPSRDNDFGQVFFLAFPAVVDGSKSDVQYTLERPGRDDPIRKNNWDIVGVNDVRALRCRYLSFLV